MEELKKEAKKVFEEGGEEVLREYLNGIPFKSYLAMAQPYLPEERKGRGYIRRKRA